MNHAIITELLFFLKSVLWGSLILLAYDVLRIFRRLMKHNGIILALEDIIFWCITGLYVFAMIYKENDGVIRGFSIMGITIGMILYHFSVSEPMVAAITKVIRMILHPLVVAIRAIRKGIYFLLKKLQLILIFIITRLKKWIKSVRIALNKRLQSSKASIRRKVPKKRKPKDYKPIQNRKRLSM